MITSPIVSERDFKFRHFFYTSQLLMLFFIHQNANYNLFRVVLIILIS